MEEQKKIKILIVDDETILAKTITNVLQAKGYEVKTTSFGKQAIDWLKEGFDLVLLDVKLPDIEGTNVLKTIKRSYSNVAVIVMTAFATIETAIEIMKDGAYAYMMKPFEMEELLGNIEKAARQKREENEKIKMLTNLSLMYQLGKEMEGEIETRHISAMAARYFREVAKTDVCAIMLKKQGKDTFYFGAIDSDKKVGTESLFKVFQLDKKMADRLIIQKKALLIPDIRTELEILASLGLKNPKSLFVFPLLHGNNVAGLVLFSGEVHFNIDESTLETISTIGIEVAVCLENADRYLELKNSYLEAVKSLASTIEAKEEFNKGHSEIVSQLAVVVARKMGFPVEEVEIIKFAGFVHDIGKVTVSDNILSKKGKLLPSEMIKMQMHSTASMNIISKLKHEKSLLPMILYHHERFDGSGYPEGLSGERIPIGARILAVCDAYSAMVSPRPYRTEATPQEAIKELKRCSGRQFDPAVVDVFVKAYKDGLIL